MTSNTVTEIQESTNIRLHLFFLFLDSDLPRTKSYQTSRRAQTGHSEKSRSPVSSKSGGEFSFKEFLWEHIDTAFTKGFDDNVGRHPVAATFEVS